VTIGEDGTACIWDAVAGKVIKVLRGNDTQFHSAVFSPDGNRIVIVSKDDTDDDTARIWDVSTGNEIKVIGGHNQKITSAAFTPDGKHIVTVGDESRIWDTATGNETKVLQAQKSALTAALTSDGRYVVTTDLDDTARIWDVARGNNARILKHSKQWELLGFDKQLFAISGVSGGSLGAALAYAALADSQWIKRRSDGFARPPCKETKDTDWFAPYVKSNEPPESWQAHENWRGCLQLLVAGDFLSPVMLTLGTTDLFHYQGVGGDRAAVFERALEKRYERITGHPTLEKSLIALRQQANENGQWLPILLFNGTSVTTGRRIITSDVDTIQRTGPTEREPMGSAIPMFQDAYDFYQLVRQPSGQESRDIRLSTAVTMSARFPIISPHGNIRDVGTDEIADRVVEGGYFENFGALTATELAQELGRHGLKPVIILINNEPTTPDLRCGSSWNTVPRPEAPQKTWFASLGSPLQTAMATRQARGTLAAAVLCKETDDEGRFAFVTVDRDSYNRNKDLSMSWWLSKYVQRHLDDQLTLPINGQAFKKIAAVRKLLRPRQRHFPRRIRPR
jgi:hypothetical protein